MKGPPFRVFISYAHDDEGLWKALDNHLAQLRNDEAIAVWQDRQSLAGQEWEELEAADIVLLLIDAWKCDADARELRLLGAGHLRQRIVAWFRGAQWAIPSAWTDEQSSRRNRRLADYFGW